MVCSSVYGMSATSKTGRFHPATVRLTPSTAIDPFIATKRWSASGASIATRTPSFSRSTEATTPTASTCPCTQWPPSSSPTRSARSRLTRAPAPRPPSVVRATVSGTAVAWNTPSWTRSTVRQTPFTATLAPGSGSAPNPERIASRSPPAALPTRSTVPTRDTMPLNTMLLAARRARDRTREPHVASDAPHRERTDRDRLLEALAPQVGGPGGRRGAAQEKRRDPHGHLVGEPRAEQRRVHRGSPLDEHGV